MRREIREGMKVGVREISRHWWILGAGGDASRGKQMRLFCDREEEERVHGGEGRRERKTKGKNNSLAIQLKIQLEIGNIHCKWIPMGFTGFF